MGILRSVRAIRRFSVRTALPEPIAALGFSTLSVRLAMIQLYILFMVTPLFFVLAQVDPLQPLVQRFAG